MGLAWVGLVGVGVNGVSVDVVGAAEPVAESTQERATKTEFFERQVRPIFANHCYACHSADTKPAGGLRVDDRQGLLAGGNGGPALVPGKPDQGTLLKRISHESKKRMPAEGEPLTDEQIAILRKWVVDGAVWPAVDVKLVRDRPEYEELRTKHWAWQPRVRPVVPMVQDTAWAHDDLDRFVLARLESAQLAPVADADPVALLRRVTYDLTGLPPTLEEMESFLADRSPGAYERVVDRLLKSPQFGEQWGRHWLDVARYGESTGPSRNIPYPFAWRYRDYVIESLNQDVPYDRFLREQIAGDLLSFENSEQQIRQLIATGFLALGVKDVNQRFQVRFLMDNVDEQIDVVTRSVLGLTVSCARCHDHKFDPIPQHDYYALAGIFTSTEMYAGLRNLMGGSGLAYYVPKRLLTLPSDLPQADAATIAALQEEVRVAKEKWDAVRGKPEGLKKNDQGVPHQRQLRDVYEAAQAKLNRLTDPAASGHVAHGVRDAEKIGDTELRVRGEAEQLGPLVPRGYLTTISVPDAAPIQPQQSGRLQLAQWLTSPANPLTARVIVNRVWLHLFGRGLVSTVDNFGVTGDRPSHPELLDYLADALVADQWSLKRFIRRLVLSRTYQLSSLATDDHLQHDPATRLMWRHAPRRLTTEELRDSLLAAAGTLSHSYRDDWTTRKLKMVELRDNGPEAKAIHEQTGEATVRSIYLPQLRGVTPKSLEAFDPVDQTLVSGNREVTTVPAQALFLLNSSFVKKQSHQLARRLLALEKPAEGRVETAYRLTLGRAPSAVELQRSLAFLQKYAASYRGDEPVAANPSGGTGGEESGSSKKPVSDNPDEADQGGVTIREEVVRPGNADEAAWLAFAQALFASAEFRYVR
jgi:mono/diheme cytochrome c family protein